jgi:hypothetical protein
MIEQSPQTSVLKWEKVKLDAQSHIPIAGEKERMNIDHINLPPHSPSTFKPDNLTF